MWLGIIISCLVLLFVLPAFFLPFSAAYGQSINFTLDFEEGNLRGWAPTGGAFRFQPTFGDNPTARNRGQPSRHQGNYWIGTYEKYQGHLREKSGSIQGDEPQGTLTSAPFTIPKGTLDFLVGGGSSPQTRVELLIEEGSDPEFNKRFVLRASGRNSETMHRVQWDLSPYAGKTGMIRIIDASSAGWGHINVDDFRFPPVIPELTKPWRPLPAQEQATVPNLVGYFKEQAYELLAETRLRLGQIRDLKADQPTGTIIEQRPGPGDKVPIGTPVHLVVAVEEIVTVPNLIGYSREEAYELLANTRLKVGDITEWAADEPEGTIIDQSPSAGIRVDPGTPVELVVAITEKVTVPNLIGATMSQAEATLARSKLEVGEVAERKSDKPADTIIDQKPRTGDKVEAGTPVHLVIAAIDMVTVPNLIGNSKEEAYQRLANSRLKAGDVSEQASERLEGTILAQRPRGGESVASGTSVYLVVAKEETVTVPDLIGYSRDEAYEFLARARLAVGRIHERASDKPEGLIIDQLPGPGSKVAANTPVDLVIGTKKTVAVTWPQVVIGILVVFAAGYYIASRKKVRGETSGRMQPTITVKIHEDKGAQTIGSAVSGQTEYALRLKPKTDYGNQEIEYKDSLIIDERKDHG